MKPVISLITLGVTDFDRSLAFYRDTFGWHTTAKEGDAVAFFQLAGGLVFAIHPRHMLAKDAEVDEAGHGFPGFTIAHNLGSKTEVDAAFRELAGKGVTIMKKPHDTFWGGYSGYVADPDGYLIEIAWNPFWTMQEDGTVRL